MSSPATRQEILERIAILDKQITLESGRTRVPRLNMKHRSFPLPNWICAFGFGGFWVFGGQFLPDFHAKYAVWFAVAAGLFALWAIWGTIMWLFTGNVKKDKDYAAGMEKVKVLQDEKHALQKMLKQANG
ncbi:hypothetical protein IT570_11225 [Candidatus Sumerlaeota bacterium]|nr:hypothetical protein [Candidatus Sumerlaeota bacterium]